MTPQERDILQPLLDRLRQTRVADKDVEADQMIRQVVLAQPDAPYVLAQTVLMQDYALHAAQERIHVLEQQAAERQAADHQASGQHASGGGFLSGLLGGRSAAPAPMPAPAPPPGYGMSGGAYAQGAPQGYAQGYAPGAPQYARPSYGAQIANAVQPGGGQPSFLRSAAQAAAGVAGGALLFQGLEGLFGGHGGLGGGLLGGGSGLLGGAGGGPGFAPAQGFVDNVQASDDQPLPLPDDQGGVQGGDAGYGTDQAGYADTGGGGDIGGSDYASDDPGGSDYASDDPGGSDYASDDPGGSDYGSDDSFNS